VNILYNNRSIHGKPVNDSSTWINKEYRSIVSIYKDLYTVSYDK